MQYVFTIPKRLRIFFKYDRKLLGKLPKAAWETVREVFVEEIDYESRCVIGTAMIAGVHTFGNLINLLQFARSRHSSGWCVFGIR